jgi:hypothetical protein
MKSGKPHLLDMEAIAGHSTFPEESRGTWCLPSGRALADFALSAGFAAPRMWLGMAPAPRQATDRSNAGNPQIYMPHTRRRDTRDYAASPNAEER